MKRIDKMFADLQKLYAKRSAVDTEIQGIEASLIAEVKVAPKPTAAPAEKPAKEKPPATEKPAAKKPAAQKKPAK